MHSQVSGSGYSLYKLAELAQSKGIKAVFLADNLSKNIEFGIAPLRRIFRIFYCGRSVLLYGAEQWLNEIAMQNKTNKNVLFIPGVEVTPAYYWQGNLLKRNLQCYNLQQNIVILGIENPAFIYGIPEKRGMLWPVDIKWFVAATILAISIIITFFIWILLGIQKIYIHFAGLNCKERKVCTKPLSIITAIVLVMSILFEFISTKQSRFNIYQKPEKDHIEKIFNISSTNSFSYLAHPTSRDEQRFIKAGISIEIITRPYPELIKLTNCLAFSGVIEEPSELIKAGSLWDEVLIDYCSGKRDIPLWCIGESLYHMEGQAGKSLGNVETVIWAKRLSSNELIESLKKGKFYSRRNDKYTHLLLEEWHAEIIEDKVKVKAAVSCNNIKEKFKASLIRNGKKIYEMESKDGIINLNYTEILTSEPIYFRLIVEGRYPLLLVSNPIFCKN